MLRSDVAAGTVKRALGAEVNGSVRRGFSRFRWLIVFSKNDAVWVPTMFTKNRA
jgi:hypothetical protein